MPVTSIQLTPEEWEHVQNTIGEVYDLNRALSERVNQAENTIITMNAKHDALVKALDEMRDGFSERFMDVERTVAEHTEKDADLETRTSASEMEIDAIQALIPATDKAIADLNGEQGTQNSKLTNLENADTSLSGRVTKLEGSKPVDYQPQLKALEDRLEKLEVKPEEPS